MLWQAVFSFFKWVWRLINFIRELTINLFLVILIFTAIIIYIQTRYPSQKSTKRALVLNINGKIVDKLAVNNKIRQISQELLGLSSNQTQENSLFDLVRAIRQARYDSNITGIILSLRDFTGADQTSLQYIGKALSEFRNSGKPIYAIGDYYSQDQYFLASYASKIYLTPQGIVDLHGIATNNLYYRTLLDKLKINSHIFRVGTYKSAIEPFLRDNMSNNTRKVDSRWVNQLWHYYLTIVANNRHMTPEQFFPGTKTILNSLCAVHGDNAQLAINNKWIDEIASHSSIDDSMTKIFGWNKNKKTFNSVSVYDYRLNSTSQYKDQIAVIFADGPVIYGSDKVGFTGSETVVEHIRNAKLNPYIKAILFRVNSPGGSVIASEVIRSELASARTAGKPVVVSMGGVAASGGYWISTPANYIIAHASTLTGSIGVFGVLNTLERSLDAIGIHADGVTTSPLAGISITKPLPPEFSQIMRIRVKNHYDNFIKLVAQSRHKTVEEINSISQGRVWIGSDAARNGLVDQLGDFDDAVLKAAELAKLKKFKLNWYFNEQNLLDIFSMQVSDFLHYAIIPGLIRHQLLLYVNHIIDHSKLLSTLVDYKDPQNSYSTCLSCGRIYD